VVAVAHRLALVLTLVVAFVAMQTGWACAYGDGCADEAPQACNDDHEDEDDHEGESPCGPACTDCVGCSGPARALLAEQQWKPMASCLRVALSTHVVALVPEAEPPRIDRPPRA